jgi:hypothetical protein
METKSVLDLTHELRESAEIQNEVNGSLQREKQKADAST